MAMGTTAGARYGLRISGFMLPYGAIFLLARPFSGPPGPAPLRAFVAIALAVCVLGVIWAIGRYLVEEQDEYLRAQQAKAVLAASGLTLATYTLWGYLQLAHLAPPLPALNIFPVFSAAWIVARLGQRVLDR